MAVNLVRARGPECGLTMYFKVKGDLCWRCKRERIARRQVARDSALAPLRLGRIQRVCDMNGQQLSEWLSGLIQSSDSRES